VLELSTTGHVLTYLATEVDFDRYRADADFQALVERHRNRLLAPRSEPLPPRPEPGRPR